MTQPKLSIHRLKSNFGKCRRSRTPIVNNNNNNNNISPPVAFQDVPGQPFLMMRSKENDPERMSLYPSLDYKGLYSTLLNFIDLVQGRMKTRA